MSTTKSKILVEFQVEADVIQWFNRIAELLLSSKFGVSGYSPTYCYLALIIYQCRDGLSNVAFVELSSVPMLG